jgi:NDP-sugar pyrophosphorylase family protein
LGALVRETHKCLLPVGGEPLLARTVRQFQQQGLDEITVVVGHFADRVEAALARFSGVTLVENPDYASDINIRSLQLGLGRKAGPVLVVESDVVMDDPAVAQISTAAKSGESVWFTQGRLKPRQLGGVVRSNAAGDVTDLRYVPAYDESLSKYRKLLGVLAIGAKQRPLFQRLLREGAASSLGQYYMMPWVQHLLSLPCSAYDLAHRRVATYNTPDEYRRCCDLFEVERVVPTRFGVASVSNRSAHGDHALHLS